MRSSWLNTLAVFAALYVLPGLVHGQDKELPNWMNKMDSDSMAKQARQSNHPRTRNNHNRHRGNGKNKQQAQAGGQADAAAAQGGQGGRDSPLSKPEEIPEASKKLLESTDRTKYAFAEYHEKPFACPTKLVSCSAPALTPVDGCCTPTYGEIVFAQCWNAGLGPPDKFTIHGLWPNNCPGKARPPDTGCDDARTTKDILSLLSDKLKQELDAIWLAMKGPAENHKFWQHEWNKHGTCLTTLQPRCFTAGSVVSVRDGAPVHTTNTYQAGDDLRVYMRTALDLAKKYDPYLAFKEAGILPGKAYPVDQMVRAIEAKYGMRPKIKCERARPDVLAEIEFHFIMRGMDTFIPVHSRFKSLKTCKPSLMWEAKNAGK